LLDGAALEGERVFKEAIDFADEGFVGANDSISEALSSAATSKSPHATLGD